MERFGDDFTDAEFSKLVAQQVKPWWNVAFDEPPVVKHMGFTYPLVMTNIAIENGHV